MSTPAERQENHRTVDQLITLAAKGDPSAERYLRMIAGAARTLDDLVDADHPVPQGEVVLAFAGLLVGLNHNAFFLKHREALVALHQMALNAWLDANEWEKSPDPDRRIYAHVLRDAVNEILPAVAYLTGGWEHMRAVSRQTRELFKKEIT
jgi:hypothetical protein